MDTILQSFTALMVIGVFVLAYFSAKTWRIGHIVLAVFNFLFILAFFYLAARTLKTHQSWRDAVGRMQQQITQLKYERDGLLQGAKDENDKLLAGVRPLRHELARLAVGRGDVWYNVAPERVDPATGKSQLSVKAPDPHGIAPQAELHVFGMVDQKLAYLGEFLVSAADEKAKSVSIEPKLVPSPEELQQIATAKGPWTLYVLPPLRTGPQRKTEPGELTIAREKKELDALLEGKHDLRDIAVASSYVHGLRDTLGSDIRLLKDRQAKLEAAKQLFDKSTAYRKTEQGLLKSDLEKFEYEKQAVEKYFGELKKAYEQTAGMVQRAIAANRVLAAELAKAQLQAADEINRRAGAVARQP